MAYTFQDERYTFLKIIEFLIFSKKIVFFSYGNWFIINLDMRKSIFIKIKFK